MARKIAKPVELSERMGRKRQRKKIRRTPVGEVPGSLIPSAEDTEPTQVRVVRYTGESYQEEVAAQVKVEELSPGSEILWIDVRGLKDANLIAKIGQQFSIHHLAMEDVLYGHQAKVDDFGPYLRILFPSLTGSSSDSEPISMFLGANYVLSFRSKKEKDTLEPVRERLAQSRGRIRHQGSDYLAYALIDATIDAYFPLIDSWSDRLLDLEQRALARPTSELWVSICELRSQVLTLRRGLGRFREVLTTLVNQESPLLAPDHRPYYKDARDHLVELVDLLDELRETTGELMNTFHARQAQNGNDVIQVLTMVSTIFIPLSFIAGLYGMNFDRSSTYNMPELSWRYGYPFALSLMGLTALFFLYYFWRKGWFTR